MRQQPSPVLRNNVSRVYFVHSIQRVVVIGSGIGCSSADEIRGRGDFERNVSRQIEVVVEMAQLNK